MAKPLKFIGRHGERKCVVVYREVPTQEHMCLVVYPDRLNISMHDALMKVVESDEAQTSQSLSDALHRNIFPEGGNMLGELHRQGYLKKVEARQVYMTPNPKSSMNLAEMNEMINAMNSGEEAKKKMQKLDANRGFQDPIKTTSTDINTDGALSDADIAKSNLQQAKQMEAEAKQLVAEAKRLKAEAEKLNPTKTTKAVTKKTTVKKTTAKKTKAKVKV